MSRYRAEAICAGALLMLALNCIFAIGRTSLTSDEIIHITSGYYSWTAAEYTVNSEHPPLAKMWAALPLLAFLPRDAGPEHAPGNFSERGGHFNNHFWQTNRADFARISFWTRAPMAALAVALGALLFMATRMLFGSLAAVFAVLIYSLEPTVLGHGKLVHTDVPATFFYLLFFFVLYRYARNPGGANAALLGLATGAALLTKYSMIVLLPALAAFFAFEIWRRGIKWKQPALHALCVGLLALLAINVVYQFRSHPLSQPDIDWIGLSSERSGAVVRRIELLSAILPTDFLYGIRTVAGHNTSGHSASIMGQYDHRGWWYYFPVAFALKTPPPFLFLAAAGLLFALWRVAARRDYVFLLVLAPLAIYAALAMSSRINIGVRHFLPVFPFLMILSGALLARVCAYARKPGLILAMTAIAWMAVETARTYPYYLSYVNPLTVNGPSWRYLSDSNIDWGDAVPELAAFLHSRGVTQVRAAILGGGLTLSMYGIEYVNIFSESAPETDYVVLGASFLNGSTVDYGDASNGRGAELERIHFFDAYRRREPEAIIGNSIYVFKER